MAVLEGGGQMVMCYLYDITKDLNEEQSGTCHTDLRKRFFLKNEQGYGYRLPHVIY